MHQLLQRDIDLIRFAREIAVDHREIDDLLDQYQMDYDTFRLLHEFPRFTRLLANETEAWNAARNTHERVKFKSAALIEHYLEEAQASLHDPNQSLVAKTGLAKLIGSFAGMGEEANRMKGGGGGSGFSITINLGERSVNVTNQIEYEEDDDVVDVEPVLPPIDIGEDVHAINASLLTLESADAPDPE